MLACVQTLYCVLGRMWRLCFAINFESTWLVVLTISDRSPPTWVVSHLIIDEPPQSSVTSTPVASSLIDCATQEPRPVWQQSQNVAKCKPKIDIPLQTGSRTQLSADHPICTVLTDTSLASSLRYEQVSCHFDLSRVFCTD
jgi:hypothetical protein